MNFKQNLWVVLMVLSSGVVYAEAPVFLNQEQAGSIIEKTLDTIEGARQNKKIPIDVLELTGTDIPTSLELIAQKSGLTIIGGENAEGKVTVYLKDIDVGDALRIILEASGFAYTEENGLIRIMTAGDFESRQGYSFTKDIQTKILPVQYARAKDILEILTPLKGESGRIIPDERNNALILMGAVPNVAAMTDLVKQLDVRTVTETFLLRHVHAQSIVKDIQAMLTKNVGRIQLASDANSFAVTDTPENIQTIKQRVEALDRQEQRILLEVKILRIVLNDEYSKGVDWEAIVTDYQPMGPLSVGTVSDEDFVILLDALDAVGVIQTISDEKRTVDIGKAFPIAIKEDTELQWTPVLENTENLTVQIQLGGQETKAAVKTQDGHTIVIGGLFEEITVESLRKIPFLGDLPLVGFAFRNQGQRSRTTEYVAFLTPKVIVKE